MGIVVGAVGLVVGADVVGITVVGIVTTWGSVTGV